MKGMANRQKRVVVAKGSMKQRRYNGKSWLKITNISFKKKRTKSGKKR